MERRWSFLLQMASLTLEGTIAIIVKVIVDMWPTHAIEWSPGKWLTIASLLMVSSSIAMLYGAYYISGTGWKPTKKKKLKLLTTLTTGETVQLDERDDQDEEETLELLDV